MIKNKYLLKILSGIFILLLSGLSMFTFSTPDSIDPRIRPDKQLIIYSSDQNLNNALSASMEYIYNFLIVGPKQFPVTENEPRITKFRDYGLSAIPSLWGSYHGKPDPKARGYRENFCLRDVAHQTEGAALLSLNEENYTMLKLFAADALKATRVDINASDFDPGNPEDSARNKSYLEKYWALWSYNFYGFPYYMDSGYQELPAPFELLEKVYQMYQYTGDSRWLSDTFIDYGRMMHNQFMVTYDFNGNHVADNRGRVGTLPTYWEQEGDSHLTSEDFVYDQSTSPAKLIIKKTYFSRIGVQDLLLKIRFKNGKDDFLTVRINNFSNPDGSRPLLNHDYIRMNSRAGIDTINDLSIIMSTPQSVGLTDIYDGAKRLIVNQDYVKSGNIVTIKADYFYDIIKYKSRNIKSSFRFKFSDGNQANIVVDITDIKPDNILNIHEVILDWNQLEDTALQIDLSSTNGNTDLYRIENDMRRVSEAGDTLGAQYQSLLAFSKMLKAKAKLSPEQANILNNESDIYAKKSEDLLNYYRVTYYSNEKNTYARAYDSYGKAVYGWGHENSYFMPLKNLLEPGEKANSYLKFIHDTVLDQGLNEEAITYLPEVFYNYGKNEEAWLWLKRNLSRFYNEVSDEIKQRTYPEIAITNISNIINHMMGFLPDVAERKIATLSRLTNDLEYIQVENIPFGQSIINIEDYTRKIRNLINLRHEGNTTSKLTNDYTSKDTILWQAQFEGEHKYIYSEGLKYNATISDNNGVPISWIELDLRPGVTRKVSIEEIDSFANQ
ncbi:MAG: hypothetical protein K0U59_08340 [Gammaproteobacteria bacterium]|nr:hypothetical protein [Gammaproteobacteria bacterium]